MKNFTSCVVCYKVLMFIDLKNHQCDDIKIIEPVDIKYQIYEKIPIFPLVPIIGTHGDRFHCDDVLSCSLLLMTKEFHHSIIIRTRDQSELDKCNVVVDVGGVYDYEKKDLIIIKVHST